MNPFHTEIDQLAMGGTHGRLSDRRRLIHQRSRSIFKGFRGNESFDHYEFGSRV